MSNKMNDEEYSKQLEQRYQFQPWYIKLWRRRYYLTIPFLTLSVWLKSRKQFLLIWSLSIGMVQGKMRWYYTMDEVRDRMNKRKEEILSRKK